ncbi:zinc ABC transporter substrate-binding protein [Bengtsoniella intestinalis]|uniref:metal ABC transporter solute-binding protein, Zn/Mn family n=1 Tax=Bengtsoniella intestinalis TaxID=3073143 RepID=UPI00391F97EB
MTHMCVRWMIGLLSIGLLAGCGAVETVADERLQVVATTTMLADLVRVIGGDEVAVHGLMGSGVDPHLYQASAGDVTAMEQADLVVYNGLHLEGKMADLFGTLALTGTATLCAADGVEEEWLLFSDDGCTYDPHIWFDVSLWKQVAVYIADGLSELDPAEEECYQENLQGYLQALDTLEIYIKIRVSELEETQKILITAHDAFGYFGKSYGFTVLGIQGISTDSEASTGEVAALADYIVDNGVGAIFIESSVPIKSIQALQAAVEAQGFSVSIGGELYTDSLGDEASDTDTYLTTVRANVDTIVDGLKG